MGDTRRSYDRIARPYRERFEHELDDKPFDRNFLERVSGELPGGAVVVDLGCGPGQIGAHLAARGARVVGVDLSLEMLRPQGGTAGTPSVQADMRRLPLRASSVHGVVAFYSLIHLPPGDIAGAVSEIARVLVTGGTTGIAVHSAEPPERPSSSQPIPGGGLHLAEMLSEGVDLDFYFYRPDRLQELLAGAGLEVVWSRERDPYPEGVEVQTRRAYVLARKQSGPG